MKPKVNSTHAQQLRSVQDRGQNQAARLAKTSFVLFSLFSLFIVYRVSEVERGSRAVVRSPPSTLRNVVQMTNESNHGVSSQSWHWLTFWVSWNRGKDSERIPENIETQQCGVPLTNYHMERIMAPSRVLEDRSCTNVVGAVSRAHHCSHSLSQ